MQIAWLLFTLLSLSLALAGISSYADLLEMPCTGTTCLALETGGLSVEVYDDGVGLPEHFHYGVGLISMRERCAELGGALVVASAAGGGTQMRAWLPLLGET